MVLMDIWLLLSKHIDEAIAVPFDDFRLKK